MSKSNTNLANLTTQELEILAKYGLIEKIENFVSSKNVEMNNYDSLDNLDDLTKDKLQINSQNPENQLQSQTQNQTEIEILKKEIQQKIRQLETQKADLDSTKTDFETFYPTQIMTSAWEIFYAWIIRMIMTGKYFTGQIPFEKYFCHAWVLDEKGRKMSKSLGNVVDPSAEIAKYSSDAVRLSLLAGTIAGKNLRYQGKSAEKYRNFITKIINVAKFFEYQENLKN